jgi:hypothetical protein
MASATSPAAAPCKNDRRLASNSLQFVGDASPCERDTRPAEGAGNERVDEQTVAKPEELLSRCREGFSSDTNDRPDHRIDSGPDVGDATRVGQAVELNHVESHGIDDARDVRRALIGEDADAPNARWSLI